MILSGKEIKKQVGDKKIICALSGGVDSSVVAQLLNKAVGKNLYCIFVNSRVYDLFDFHGNRQHST